MKYPFDLHHFVFRVVQDAVNESSRDYWLRRAEQFEAALPRPGDFHGHAMAEDVRTRSLDIKMKAQACRNRAELCRLTDDEDHLVLDLIARNLGQVAA